MGGCVGNPKKQPKNVQPVESAAPKNDELNLQKQRQAEEQQRKRQEQQKKARLIAEQAERKRLAQLQKQNARKSVQKQFNRYEDVENDYEVLGKKRVGIGFNHAAATLY